MNRDELVKLIATTLDRAPYYHEDAAPEVMDALWPVLAQVWAEGYEAGTEHGESGFVAGTHRKLANTPNPYKEST